MIGSYNATDYDIFHVNVSNKSYPITNCYYDVGELDLHGYED